MFPGGACDALGARNTHSTPSSKERNIAKLYAPCFGGLGGVAGARATSKALCQLNEVSEIEVSVEKYLWLFARRRVGWHYRWSGIATGAGSWMRLLVWC